MSKYNLNAYRLQEYKNADGRKSARLSLMQYFEAVGHSRDIGTIELDDEDIKYLMEKYKISELENKEIEHEMTFKKLSEIQDEIKFLKSN